MKKNILLERHPHLRNAWNDVSKLLSISKKLLLDNKGINVKEISPKDSWTDFIYDNFKEIWTISTSLGWKTKVPPIESHPNIHIQLYIDAISMISDLESIINFINNEKKN